MILRAQPSLKIFFLIVILILPRVSHGRWLSFGGTQDGPGATTTTLPTTTTMASTTTSSTSYFQLKTSSMAEQSKIVVTNLADSFGGAFKGAMHKVGNYVPIRGMASVAADLGIPGGEYVLKALTPTSSPPAAQKSKVPVPRQSTSINPRFSAWARASIGAEEDPPEPVTSSPPSYREEVSSLMGTMFGERQCLMKLACLSGRRLSAVRGASAVTMILSTVAGIMPESMQEPYQALKNSIMYTDECQQYHCHDGASPEP